MKKICPVCQTEFEKRLNESRRYWETKIYCSYQCYWKNKVGFKHSEETIQKFQGRIPYNKGKKLPKLSGANHPNWKGGEVEKECKMCGSKFFVKQHRKKIALYCSRKSLRDNLLRFSQWVIFILSYTPRKCKTNDNLGLTPINEKERKSKKYKEWRMKIFKRDNYTCQECGLRSGRGKTTILQVDHIKPFAYFPKLRFDVNNGWTLCEDCHKKTETFGTKLMWSIRKSLVAVTNNI